MGEIIARNKLSWLKLLIKLLLLAVYIIVSMMHGHTNIKKMEMNDDQTFTQT